LFLTEWIVDVNLSKCNAGCAKKLLLKDGWIIQTHSQWVSVAKKIKNTQELFTQKGGIS